VLTVARASDVPPGFVCIRQNGSVPAPTELPSEFPSGVRAFHDLWSVGGRVVVLRALLDRPCTFSQIVDAVDLTRGATYAALMQLVATGYVVDDAVTRTAAGHRPRGTVYAPDRARLMRDLGAVVAWLGA
jgi:hypothetical protein